MVLLKKIISLLLCSIIAISAFAVFPTSISAKDTESAEVGYTDPTYPDFEYKLINDSEAEISKYNGTDSNVVIPSKLGGYRITKIGESSFENCTSILSVTIPDSVTYIKKWAFSGCVGLTSISIPATVASIGYNAFYLCSGVNSIHVDTANSCFDSRNNCNAVIASDTNSILFGCNNTVIPDSVTGIERNAFSGREGLTSISIPNSVTRIENGAFYRCTGLTSITIPDSVKKIGEEAFLECSALQSISFPETVMNIGVNAFYKTAWFNNQPQGVVYAGKNVYQHKGACPESIVIKEGTLGISEVAFVGHLHSITIPASVVSIGNRAFGYYRYDMIMTKEENFTVFGYEGTAAERYAQEYDLNFVPLQESKAYHYYAYGGTSYGYDWTYSGGKDIVNINCSYDFSLREYDFLISGIRQGTAEIVLFYYADDNRQIEVPLKIQVDSDLNVTALNDISNCTITLSQTAYTYDGSEKKPSVTVKYGTTTLTNGADYSVAYSNNINAGTATATVTGKGNYTGTESKSFTINKASIAGYTVTLGTTSYTYDGTEKKPTVTVKNGTKILTSGTDYSVSYSNNKNVGTATVTVTGKGNYSGTTSKTFTITEAPKVNVSNCTITLSTTSYTYDGTEKKPSVTVKYGATTLTNGTDYSVAYSNNTNAGSAAVTVTGKGGYTGTASKSFTINKASISGYTVTLSQSSYTYDGTSKTPTVTVKNGSKVLTNNTDYSVSYSNNKNIGTATATATGKGNYTGSVSKNFSIISAKKEFKWGEDNWSYNNSTSYFKNSTYRSQINNSYLNTLKNNLTNSEYQTVFVRNGSYKALLDDSWGGSCYGMSSLALLSKQGIVPYAKYKSGADKLHDLNYPRIDNNVSSLVTYYQMLQIKGVIQQQYRTVPYRSHETNIKAIISELNNNSTALICFKKSGWGAHAILATGYEYGSWTWNGVTYQGCIKICDPNASVAYNNKCNIYFNTSTYNWCIPFYSGYNIMSTKGAVFMYIGASVNDINKGGYLSGSTGDKIEDYVARIDAQQIATNRSVTKVEESNGTYISRATAPGDIIEDYSYVLGNESEGTIGYNLYDPYAAYRVSQDEAQNLELTMDYESCDLYGGSKAGNSVLFDPAGYIEVEGESASYNMGMTFDDEYPTDWFSIEITGNGANNASLKKADKGYYLCSDSLNDVEVKANNKDDIVTVSFSTNYDSVFLCEINETTIGVMVDTDNNGTYETNLLTGEASENWSVLGDADGNGIIESVDATNIQRYLAEIPTPYTKEDLLRGDVDGSGDLELTDVTAIQYSLCKMKTTFQVGTLLPL